jgi:hypothetical protein
MTEAKEPTTSFIKFFLLNSISAGARQYYTGWVKSEKPTPGTEQMVNSKKNDWISLGVVVFFFLAFIFSYLGLIAKGFSPIDDALRHVAKVVSGKSWDEILVLRPDYNGKLDTHPGWHTILSVFYWLGLGKDALICVSVAIPWVIMFGIFIAFLKRPECLVIILSVFFLMDPGLCIRFFWGRPFLVAMDMTMAYLFLWGGKENIKPSGALLIITIVLSAIHVWIHPSWYLLSLPVFSVLVSGILKKDIRTPIYFAICIMSGIIIGALLSWHPIDILRQNIQTLGFAIFGGAPALVPEFQPFVVSAGTVAILTLGLLSRLLVHPWPGIDWRHPAIILTFLGLAMGFFIGRFWSDWGFGGALVWLCLDLQCLMKDRIGERAVSRIVIAGIASLLLAVIVPGLVRLFPQFNIAQDVTMIEKSYEKDKTWFPGDGGIVYSNAMSTFYLFFYTLPHGNWRYILGYEQGLMPEEDREIRYTDPEGSYERVVKKMKPVDRLVFYGEEINKDKIEKNAVLSRLEWKFVGRNYLLGRMKR